MHLFTVPARWYVPTSSTSPIFFAPARTGLAVKLLKDLHKEVVLSYPDYSKVFEIYMDASSKQLGAIITQDNRPIVFLVGNSLMRNANAVSPKLN